MTEEQIKDVLNSKNKFEATKKLMIIFPNGFEINKIDKRIKNKLEEPPDKYNDIQNPIEIRRKSNKNI